MNLFKLSMMNLKQNLKNYGMYVFSMVFCILVFYNFITLINSEQFKSIKELQTVSMIAGMCCIVLVLFFIFFISYSSSFFIEQRKKEFGIYTFMGLENKSIALLFAVEGLLIGLISLIFGIFLGIISNKIFMMAILKLGNVDNTIKFEISNSSLIQASLMFLLILICIFIKEYISLVRTDVSKLINASNAYQTEETKNSKIKGALGFLIIVSAYIFILGFKKLNIPFPMAIMFTVVMVILGTAFLFKGFFTLFINKIIKNKKILYKNTNVISYNNIIFRIKNNNKTLSQVAILITCALTSIITAFCMKDLLLGGYEMEVPYSFYYISQNEKDENIVSDVIKNSKEDVDFRIDLDLIPYKANANPYVSDINIVKYSDMENLINHKKIQNYKKLIKSKPNKGEGIIVIPKNIINAFNFEEDLNIKNKNIKVKDSFGSSILGILKNDSLSDTLLVVSDEDYAYFEKNINDSKILFRGVTLKNYDSTKEISSYISQNTDMPLFSADMFNESKYDFINSVYFIGLFLSLVFMVSLGSIMYFKCISDASIDKKRFDILRKIGVSQEYIDKSIFKQIAIFFSLPLGVGILHSIVAGYAVNGLFNNDSYFSIILSVSLFTIIYLIYYLLSVKKYINITK